ncbi:MAG: radical SAM protein [Candidatus Gracilibacteria bacterium]|jgi:adenine C2-methylase RlmN of 23S rRNA A2503 and tRNA A37
MTPIDTPHDHSLQILGSPDDSPYDSNGNHALRISVLPHEFADNQRAKPIVARVLPRDRRGSGHVFEISPQLGCVMGCKFCSHSPDKDALHRSLTPEQVVDQIKILEEQAVQRNFQINPYKINFTDGGELLLNPHCRDILVAVSRHLRRKIKISTVLPDLPIVRRNLEEVFDFMKDYEPGLSWQISLASTNEQGRQEQRQPQKRRVPLYSMEGIKDVCERIQQAYEGIRKATLTFTLTENSDCDPREIIDVLPPHLVRPRLHPFKENRTGCESMPTDRIEELRTAFIKAGYADTAIDTLDEVESLELTKGKTDR